jgi:hypothetical protein
MGIARTPVNSPGPDTSQPGSKPPVPELREKTRFAPSKAPYKTIKPFKISLLT